MNEFKELARMCEKSKEGCSSCKLSRYNTGKNLICSTFIKMFPEEATEIVHEWAEENPVKTRKDLLLEKFPNARMADDGGPRVCAYDLGIRDENECLGLTCLDCWLVEVDE